MSTDLLERLKSALADRYAVESEIGRGGMATVYLAEDLKHHRKVAIKVLHPELAAAVGGQRFLQEIETVASLNHPHILMLIDSGEAEGLLYYVMPYAEGESLRQRLDRERQLAVDESVRIVAEVADGLDYAHRKGVVHRDIKPGNILLSERHAVIADFGIARAIEVAKGERVTSTGLGVGTPLYASPEQATGEETLDGRTDVYSLACVLYEMLAGEPPLTGSTPQMIQARRMSETPTALHALRETVPPELDGVIARALARVPADRYSTAAQFGQALQAVLTGRTPSAEADLAATPALEVTVPPTAPEPERQKPRRARWLAPVAGFAIIAAVGALVWTQVTGRDDGRRGVRIPAGATDLGPHSVAVLPLANDTGEDSLNWLVPGLANMLTRDLTQVEGLKVVGDERVLDLMRQAELESTERVMLDQALSLGANSGAHALVYGSFDKSGDEYQLDVELIDLSDSTVIETAAASGPDVLTLVDSVAAPLASRVLGDTIALDDLTPLSRIATANLDAYRAYQRGLLPELRSQPAEEHYQRAIVLDSTFALAWLQVSLLRYGDYDYSASTYAIKKAQAHAADVTRRDRLWIQAYVARCAERYDEAIGYMEELIATYPDEKRGRFVLGVMYRNQNRLEEQQLVLEELLWLDPSAVWVINELAYTAVRTGDASRADSLSQVVFERSPKHWNTYDSRGEILELLGRKEEARAMFREAIRLNPSRWKGYANLVKSYLDADDPAGGREALEEFVDGDDLEGQFYAQLFTADTYVSEGRYREALVPMQGASERTIALGMEQEFSTLTETGVHALAVGTFEQAEDSFWKVMHADLFRTDAVFGLLSTYGSQQRFDDMNRVRDTVVADIRAMPEPERQATESLLLVCDGLVAWYRAGDARETVRLIGEARDLAGVSRTVWPPAMGIQGEEILALIQVARASDALKLIDSMERLPERDYGRLFAHAAWYLRGRAYEALGETEQALRSYGKLLDVAGDGVREVTLFQDTQERLARLSAGLGDEP